MIQSLLFPEKRSRKIVNCAVTALFVTLASPPRDLWPLAFVAFVPLYGVLRRSSAGEAFLYGWFTAAAFFLAGSSWWAPLITRFAHASFPFSLGLTLLFCLYQALPLALVGTFANLLHNRYHLSWLLSGPLLLIFLETLWPFFFKTYLAILAWKAWPLTQLAELGGPAVVSGALLLINFALAEGVGKGARAEQLRIVYVLIVILFGAGGLRALQVEQLRQSAPKMKVGILQPNFGIVPVEERKINSKRYVELLRSANRDLAQQGAELAVWPESSWPLLFDRTMRHGYPAGHPWELRGGIPTRLLFGTLSHDFKGTKVFNSAVYVSAGGVIGGIYDKNILVPFGEYIPFAETFPDWAKEVKQNTPLWPDIMRGDGPRILEDGRLRIAPLICSEDLDSRYVMQAMEEHPNLFVSIISDAWFADSGAPWQHLALASFRAIEARRDLVRATNTGVSAFISASGRVTRNSPLRNIEKNVLPPPDLITNEVSLLDIIPATPFIYRWIPLLCLAGIAAAIIRNRNGGR